MFATILRMVAGGFRRNPLQGLHLKIPQIILRGMENEPRPVIDVTTSALRVYAAELHKLADLHVSIAEMMENSGVPGVCAGNLITAINAHIGLSNFCSAVVKALMHEHTIDGIGGIAGAVLEFERVKAREKRDIKSPPKDAPPRPTVDEARAARHAKGDTEREQKGKKPGKRG